MADITECYPGLGTDCTEAVKPKSAQPVAPPPPPAGQLSEADLEKVFKTYLRAWRYGDVDVQNEYLSSDFYYIDERGRPSGYQERETYLAQKSRIAQDQEWLEITTSDTNFRIEGETGVVTYRQLYNNPRYCSVGTNKFHVRKEGSSAKIYREEFRADKRIPKTGKPSRSCPALL